MSSFFANFSHTPNNDHCTFQNDRLLCQTLQNSMEAASFCKCATSPLTGAIVHTGCAHLFDNKLVVTIVHLLPLIPAFLVSIDGANPIYRWCGFLCFRAILDFLQLFWGIRTQCCPIGRADGKHPNYLRNVSTASLNNEPNNHRLRPYFLFDHWRGSKLFRIIDLGFKI